MDSASDISLYKKLLNQLDTVERVDCVELLFQLENILDHLPAQVAPRLQRDLDQCISRSEQVLNNLFDRAEISDKNLLNALLRLLLAYGNFKLNLITYHIDTVRDEVQPDILRTPILVKTKWYDLTPLLPPAGTMTWKAILITSLVKDPEFPSLRATCMDLLTQKLHFYATIKHIDRFRKQIDLIQNNAKRVAETISESIFDAANDDQEVVVLELFTFNLLILFIDVDQQKAVLEAIALSRFKPELPMELKTLQETSHKQLDRLVDRCIMTSPQLQEVYLIKLVEQLKCNIIRHKRRHSIDSDHQEVVTLQIILSDILHGVDFNETLSKLATVKVKSKSLQRSYLASWTDYVDILITKKLLTPKSSAIIINVCSSILVTCSTLIDDNSKSALCSLLAKTIDVTGSKKLDRLFQICNPNFLLELTKLVAELTDLLDQFGTPLMRFYRSYFSRHMRMCIAKSFQKDVEKFGVFIEFICERTIGKSKSTILGYTYLCELSAFLETIKAKGKTTELYVDYGRSIGKKLYSFIKNRPFTKQTDVDEIMDTPQVNGINESIASDVHISDRLQIIVIDALVCVLKIAVDCKEQAILDTYGELMLKLFDHMSSRLGELMEETRTGSICEYKPIDANLFRLINLYVSHRDIIQSYLSYDLNRNICERLLVQKNSELDTHESEEAHARRKLTYSRIKSKLELMEKRDELVFQTIINKQYSSAVDQNMGQISDLAREEPCGKRYLAHMNLLTDVLRMASNNCDPETYENVLCNVVKQFEWCDALDHPRVLNLLHVLGALIPKTSEKNAKKAELFKEVFPTIGCCLVRMAKSVELGPSVLSFSNPGVHKSSGTIQCCTYSNCIRIYTLIFNQFPPTFTNSLITDAMQICVSANLIRYAKYSVKLHKFFIQLASSVASLLKAISMGKRDIVEQAMPVFLSVFSLLIRCIILASDRKKLEDLPKYRINGHGGKSGDSKTPGSNGESQVHERCQVYESHLECLARDVGRLLNNLCFLETKLVDYAPHLISTYVKDTQRASCPDFVKKHLDEGIFRIFNLVDSYQKDRMDQVTDAGVQRKTTAGRAIGSIFDMIHARLDQASREIFKDMHDNYNRFHRYLGKC